MSRWFRTWLPAWLVLLQLCAPAFAAAEPNAVEQAFSALWQREWAWRLKEQPLLASSVGVYRYDDQLGEVSVAAQQRRKRYWQNIVRELEALDSTKLSVPERINYEIYRQQLQSLIADVELEGYLMSINSDSSFYGAMAFLPRNQRLRNAADYDNYLKRLAQLPKYFAQHTQLLRLGLKRGMTAPRVTLQGRERELAIEAEHADATRSLYYEPLLRIPDSVSKADAVALQQRAQTLIQSAVQPAYRSLYRFMQREYLPNARNSIAAYELPQGKAFYQ
jgi:uncharacterized protein (DUF885 family)